eukprot:121294-Chlamydomonas_euryale.AAC.1
MSTRWVSQLAAPPPGANRSSSAANRQPPAANRPSVAETSASAAATAVAASACRGAEIAPHPVRDSDSARSKVTTAGHTALPHGER